MVAEAMDALIPCVALICVALLVLSFILRIRSRRREETAIRIWCDAKGYAISQIRPVNISLFATFAFWIVGWLMYFVTYQQGWRLKVFDDDGGEKTIVVRVSGDGHVEETFG